VARCFYAPILIARGKLAQAERILIAAEIGYDRAISHHAREARAWLAESGYVRAEWRRRGVCSRAPSLACDPRLRTLGRSDSHSVVIAFSPIVGLLSPTRLGFEVGWLLMTLANLIVYLLVLAVFVIGMFARLPGARKAIDAVERENEQVAGQA
jgi:hypothetical protein